MFRGLLNKGGSSESTTKDKIICANKLHWKLIRSSLQWFGKLMKVDILVKVPYGFVQQSGKLRNCEEKGLSSEIVKAKQKRREKAEKEQQEQTVTQEPWIRKRTMPEIFKPKKKL